MCQRKKDKNYTYIKKETREIVKEYNKKNAETLTSPIKGKVPMENTK